MMKKMFVAAIMVMACVAVMAQPRAIGLRGGLGAGISYEHQLGQNMLSVDAAFLAVPARDFTPGLEGVVTYDWINPFGTAVPWNKRGEWNWYMGVGAGVGAFLSSHIVSAPDGGQVVRDVNNNVFIGVAGRIGIEYDFWFPLQLSLDWRPLVGPGFNLYTQNTAGVVTDSHMSMYYNTAGLVVGGIALGIRYKF